MLGLHEYTGFAVSGSRRPNVGEIYAFTEICEVLGVGRKVLTGDAKGIDAMARSWFGKYAKVYEVKGTEKKHFAMRSARMVGDMTKEMLLIAVPNKKCPVVVKPKKTWASASGSGTWGTVALAVGKGFDVMVYLSWGTRPPAWGMDYVWKTEGSGTASGCWWSCQYIPRATQLSLF